METQIDLNEDERFPTFRNAGRALWRGVQKVGRGVKKLRRPALILLLILAVAHAGLNIYASVLLNRELGAIRAKGEPMALRELAPAPVSESQNAAPLYRKAYAARQLKRSEELDLDKLISQGEELDANGRVILQRNQQAIAMARQAAALPFCRFDSTWEDKSPVEIMFPQYAELRALARLLRTDAVQSARAGDSKNSLRDVQAIYRMGDHLTNEPVLISFLVARALSAIGDRALADVLEIQPLSPARAQAFEASLPRTDWSAALRRIQMGERTFGIWAFEHMQANPAETYYQLIYEPTLALPDWSLKPLMVLWAPLLKLDEVYYLRFWKAHLDALQPLQLPLQQHKANDRSEEDLPFYARLTSFIMPVFSRVNEQRDTIEVARCQRQNVLAIFAYRQAHSGTYPATLKEAATAWNEPLLLDPYSAKPFGYRSDGKSFTLYSFGRNTGDDKGVNAYREGFAASKKNHVAPNADDLVWNYRGRNADS